MLRPALLVSAAMALAVAAVADDTSRSAPAPRVANVAPVVGTHAPDVAMLERPGLYGLNMPSPGTGYAVVQGSVVKIDLATRLILSIVRPLPR